MSDNISLQESWAVRDGVLRIGSWEVGPDAPEGSGADFEDIAEFASGALANNKLSADKVLETYTQGMPVSEDELLAIRANVLNTFGKLLYVYGEDPDVLWGLPNGGQDYALWLGGMFGIPVARLGKATKEPGKKTFRPLTADDAKLLRKGRRMIGFEDAGNAGTSPHGAFYESDEQGLDMLRHNTMGFNFLWVRGRLQRLDRLKIPMNTVVDARVPNRITRKDAFYQDFGHWAIRGK